MNQTHTASRAALVATLIWGNLLVPTASYAQTDQRIVLRCTYDGYNNQTEDYVIDLAANTISETLTMEKSGGPTVVQTSQWNLAQVTNDQITWVESNNIRSSTSTLNRYTGQIVEKGVAGGTSFTAISSCQRQQKQF